MNQGNIRLQSYGIDIAQMPNDKQIKMLRSFFNKLEGDVTVDFSSYQGANIGSVEYSEGTASSRILNDITSFYETGVVPEGTAGGINDFIRYSLYVDANGVIIPTVEKQFNSNSMAKRSEEIFDAVKNELLKLNNDSVVIRDNNKRVYFDNIFVEEFTSSADTQNTFRETKAIKMNAAYDAKNIVEYSKYIKPLANNGTHDNEYADATNGFEYYKAEFAIKENDGTYTLCGATLVVRIDKNNKPYVYDFVSPKIKKKGLILTPSKTVSGMGLTSNTMNSRSPSEPNITQSDKEVNSVMNEGTDTRESLSIDSLGRELSEGQREYFKNSMVVDENGRLKVMYHGSRTPGFTVFNPDQADDGISLFFTDNLDNAASYSATREIYSPDKHYSFDELNEMVQGTTNGDWEVSKDGNEYVILEAGEYEETRGTLDDIRDYFINNYLPYIYEQNGANYEVYINLTNPLVVDANNNNWDELSGIWNGKISHQYEYALLYNQLGDDLWEIEYSDFGDYKTESFTREQLEKKFGEDEALKLINGDEISMVVFDEKGNKVPNTTREYAQYAKDKGYDGVIFNNIIDYDVKMEVNENPSQVVIAFNSNQVKSIYNENPTDNEDIRYSVRIDNWKMLGENGDITELKNTIHEDEVFELQNADDNYKRYKKSYDGKVMIQLSEINSGGRYDRLAFVDPSSNTVDRLYRFDVPTGKDAEAAVKLMIKCEKRGVPYEQSSRVIRDFYKERSVYRYDAVNIIQDEKYDRATERGKSESDRYHSEYLSNRARDIAKTTGATFSLKDGHPNLHFEDDEMFSLSIDEDFDNLLDDLDISDEDFNAWMWEMNNLPTEEKPKRVISRRHLTRLAMGKEFQVVDGKKLAYTDERIASLYGEYANSSQEYTKAYVTYMSPADFLLLTANSDKGTKVFDRIANESSPLDMDNLKNDSQPIFLTVDLKEDGSRKDEVIGHEGRHRMYALAQAGFTQVPVVVVDYNNKYSKKPIDSVKVYPQSWRGDEGYHSGNKVEITDLVPLNRAHEEEINNKFGAGVETDERFSISIGEDFEEIFGGESSSNILDEGLKALKDIEVNSEAIKKIANGLIREYGSTYDKDTFAGNLEKIFAYIKNTNHLNYQDMLEIISDVAMPVIREATEKDSESVRAYNQFMPN